LAAIKEVRQEPAEQGYDYGNYGQADVKDLTACFVGWFADGSEDGSEKGAKPVHANPAADEREQSQDGERAEHNPGAFVRSAAVRVGV